VKVQEIPQLNKMLKHSEDGELSYGSNKKIWWICECGNAFERTPKQCLPPIKQNKLPICRVCAGKDVDHTNCIQTTHPELVQWLNNKEDALTYTIRSKRKIEWICSQCNTPRLVEPGNILVNDSTLCRECSIINSRKPNLHLMKHGKYSKYKTWTCIKGHVNKNRRKWCKECRLLKTTHPHLIKHIFDLKTQNLDNIFTTSDFKIMWKCDNIQHKPWLSTVAHITMSESWCPTCARETKTQSFDINSLTGSLYLLEAPTHLVYGISSTDKYNRHQSYGKTRKLIKLWYGTTEEVKQIETLIKHTFLHFTGSRKPGEVTESLQLTEKESVLHFIDTHLDNNPSSTTSM
jgi:hypothetical protein